MFTPTESDVCDRSPEQQTRFIPAGQRRRYPGSLIVCLFCGVLLAGCNSSKVPESSSGEGRPLRIVTTTGMVTDLVKNLVGVHAEVTGLIGEGVDPHLYRPTAADVGKLMQADLVIYNGLILEGQMGKAFEQFGRTGRVAYALGEAVPVEKRRFPEGFEAHPDPHLWGDAGLWAECIPEVAEVVAKHLPEHADEIHQNALRYIAEVRELDQKIRAMISTVPVEHRFLITAHDAFGYFSRAYNIPERSVQGITTESDPGVADIIELVNFLVQNKVPAIFVEATVNQANIKAVIEGARKQGWDVEIGGTLYSDSMGSPGTHEGTYLGMMEFNARTITKALGGTVE